MNNSSFLSVNGVTKEYNYVPALNNVNLNIEKGSFTVLLGPNGAGKTTLMRIICGLVVPNSGSVTLEGKRTDKAESTGRSRIGLLSHESLLYGNLTARQNIKFYLSLYGADKSDENIERHLDQVGLLRRADDLVKGFSRGMKQRLSIARSLVNNPDLMLLDEPYTGLDQEGRLLLRNTLKDICNAGKTVIMTTHDFIEVTELASHLVVLKKGRLKLFVEKQANSVGELEQIYSEALN